MHTTKKALIILGHPSEESLSGEHVKIAKEEAEKAGYEVAYHRAYDYPLAGHIMKEGSSPAFEKIAQDLLDAEYIFIATPMWWYAITGGLKNLLDGMIQARKHYHFKKIPWLNFGVPIGDLKNLKKVQVIATTGGPKFFYSIPFINPSLIDKQLKSAFEMCGLKFGGYKSHLFTSINNNLPAEKVQDIFKEARREIRNFLK